MNEHVNDIRSIEKYIDSLKIDKSAKDVFKKCVSYIQKSDDEMDRMRKKLNELMNSSDLLVYEKRELEAKYINVKNHLTASRKKCTMRDTRIHELEAEVSAIRKKSGLDDRLRSLESRCDQYRSMSKRLKRERDELKKQVRKLADENRMLRENLARTRIAAMALNDGGDNE